MLSSLPNIPKEQILKILGLDEICLKMLTFMVMSDTKDFSHNQLRKALDEFGYTIREPTFSRHLKHLEEKDIITRMKTDYKTIIKINEEGFLIKTISSYGKSHIVITAKNDLGLLYGVYKFMTPEL